MQQAGPCSPVVAHASCLSGEHSISVSGLLPMVTCLHGTGLPWGW